MVLSGCAITQKDIQFTWDAMKAHYGDTKTEMPEIIIKDKRLYLADGTPVFGLYLTAVHKIILYRGWDYETIIHEFHHALGNKLGERNFVWAEFVEEK